MKKHPHIRHIKLWGMVEDIQGDHWWARLKTDDNTEYYAEMKPPLPSDRRIPGCVFTAHVTKAGKFYLFWPPARPYTRRQIKKSNRWVRDTRKALGLAN